MKKSMWAVCAFGLIMLLLPLSAQASPLMGTWRVEYYNNPSLSGQPVVTLIESGIDEQLN